MTSHAVTLHLPAPLFQQFKRRAEQTHRSLETELIEAVASSPPEEEGLPPELAAAISGLGALGDEELWRAAQSQLPAETSSRLEALNLKQQNEGLDTSERGTLWQLVRESERAMLMRARAASLLKERGKTDYPRLPPPRVEEPGRGMLLPERVTDTLAT